MDSVHQWDMISTYERCGWILMLLLAIGALILERRGNIFEAQAVRHGSVPATGDSASHTIPPRLPSQPAATQTNKEDARRDAVNFVETGTIKDVKLTPEAAEILALTSIQVDFMQPAPEIMLIIGESLPAAANGEEAFRKIFKDARERLVELERQHSKRVVDEAGNAAVVVQPFKEERQALEKQVRQELVDLAGPSVAYV